MNFSRTLRTHFSKTLKTKKTKEVEQNVQKQRTLIVHKNPNLVALNRVKQSNLFSKPPKKADGFFWPRNIKNPLGEKGWFRGKGQDPDGVIDKEEEKSLDFFYHTLLRAKNRGLVVFKREK